MQPQPRLLNAENESGLEAVRVGKRQQGVKKMETRVKNRTQNETIARLSAQSERIMVDVKMRWVVAWSC